METDPQIVNILGEQVALYSSEFAPSEKFLVSFDEKYKFPEMSSGEATALKKLFVTLFSSSTTLPFLPAKKLPNPPCTESEKSLFVKSLEYRFSSLRNELIAERQSQSDSLRLRQIMDHIQRLKEYIDFAKSTEECEQVDEELLAETIGDLSDEQIQQLLKQFVFFILQGKNPLPDFIGRDPNPKGFVGRLSKRPIKDFDTFMKEYRGKSYSVPVPIEHVLKGAQLNLQALQGQLDTAIQEKLKTIFVLISDTLPETDAFWQDLDRTNLDAMVQRLLEMIQGLRADLDASEAENSTMLSIQNKMRDAILSLRQERDALQQKLTLLQGNFDQMKRESTNHNEEEASAGKDAEKMIDDLKQQLLTIENQVREKEAQRKECEAKLADAEGDRLAKEAKLREYEGREEETVKLKETVRTLQERLDEATKSASTVEGLQKRVALLEKQVSFKEQQLVDLRQHAGKLTVDIDTLLQEKSQLLEKIEEIDSRLETIEALLTKIKLLANQDAEKVISLLGNIQRDRSLYAPSDDPILQRISEAKQIAATNNPSLAPTIAEILQLVQAELTTLQSQRSALQDELNVILTKITDGQGAMEKSNELLALVRSGRDDLASKGFEYGSDEIFLKDAFRSLELERELQDAKNALDIEVQTLTTTNTDLLAEIERLKKTFNEELETLKLKVQEQATELETERKTSAITRERLSSVEVQKGALEIQIADTLSKLQRAEDELEEERRQSKETVRALEERQIKECEERLAALRLEEENKRTALLGTEGDEKTELQTQIADLLKRITETEGERDGFKSEVALEKERVVVQEKKIEEAMARDKSTLQELEDLREKLREATGTIGNLEQRVAEHDTEKSSLQNELEGKGEEIKALTATLEKERQDATTNLEELEKRKLRECEERLAALRLEEEKKRKELVGLKGVEQSGLEAKITELLAKITGIEGERDTIKGEIQRLTDIVKQKDEEITRFSLMRIADIKVVYDTRQKLQEREVYYNGLFQEKDNEIRSLAERITSDTYEKTELYKMITNIATYIASNGTTAISIDDRLNQKYGLHRILDAFSEILQTQRRPSVDGEDGTLLSGSMSRCYLVFFASYVYSRHFPIKTDGDSSYQSRIAQFCTNTINKVYTALDTHTPKELQRRGSQIPIQQKSKYVMNVLLILIKYMELIHQKGSKGPSANFLKLDLLTIDQLNTIKLIYDQLNDDPTMKIGSSQTQKELTNYFLRRSGNTDDDIGKLYLRFYYEERTQKEYPVVMMCKPEDTDLSKFTFASNLDFTQFLGSPVKPSTDSVSAPIASKLKKGPIFSFPLVFYLFMFLIRDYLSSIEGELERAGCPIPQLLRRRL